MKLYYVRHQAECVRFDTVSIDSGVAKRSWAICGRDAAGNPCIIKGEGSIAGIASFRETMSVHEVPREQYIRALEAATRLAPPAS